MKITVYWLHSRTPLLQVLVRYSKIMTRVLSQSFLFLLYKFNSKCPEVGHQPTYPFIRPTLNSVYNEVAFNEKSAITKENLCTIYFPFTYKYVTLNEKPPITKENHCIFFFFFFCYRQSWVYF